MKLKSKMPKVGEERFFEIKNPNWRHPIKMKGIVKAVQNRFTGLVVFEKGSVSEDEFILSVDSII